MDSRPEHNGSKSLSDQILPQESKSLFKSTSMGLSKDDLELLLFRSNFSKSVKLRSTLIRCTKTAKWVTIIKGLLKMVYLQNEGQVKFLGLDWRNMMFDCPVKINTNDFRISFYTGVLRKSDVKISTSHFLPE